MLWLVIRIAAIITAMTTSAHAEEGVASRYDRSSGSRVASLRTRSGRLFAFRLAVAGLQQHPSIQFDQPALAVAYSTVRDSLARLQHHANQDRDHPGRKG